MSKKNGGKKKLTAGTHKARLDAMLERMAGHRVRQPPGQPKAPRPRPPQRR